MHHDYNLQSILSDHRCPPLRANHLQPLLVPSERNELSISRQYHWLLKVMVYL